MIDGFTRVLQTASDLRVLRGLVRGAPSGSVQPHNLPMTYVTRVPPTTGAGGVARTPPAPHVTQRGQVAWLTSRSRTKSIFAAACPGHVRVAAAGGVSATTRP